LARQVVVPNNWEPLSLVDLRRRNWAEAQRGRTGQPRRLRLVSGCRVTSLGLASRFLLYGLPEAYRVKFEIFRGIAGQNWA